MTLTRTYLSAQLVAFTGFAALGYAAPARFASALGMTLHDVTALADFSATYGGLSAGVALILLAGILRPAWERAALALAVTTSLGLFEGRVTQLVQHGAAGPYIHGSMAVELLAGVAGIWLLRRAARSAPAATPATAT
jgi:hypothetical protein